MNTDVGCLILSILSMIISVDRLHEPVLLEPGQPHLQVQGVQRPYYGGRVHGGLGHAKQNW